MSIVVKGRKTKSKVVLRIAGKVKLRTTSFKFSLTAALILMAVNLRYTITDLIIKAVNFLISS